MTIIEPEWPAERSGRDQRLLDYETDPPDNGVGLEVVGKVLGASLDEIDHTIAELEKMRDVLRTEGERVGGLAAIM
jgi:hypothetical protein